MQPFVDRAKQVVSQSDFAVMVLLSPAMRPSISGRWECPDLKASRKSSKHGSCDLLASWDSLDFGP